MKSDMMESVVKSGIIKLEVVPNTKTSLNYPDEYSYID